MSVPAQCNPIVLSIKQKEADRSTLQEDLSTAPTGQKHNITAAILKLNDDIKKLEDDLALCIAAGTPQPPVSLRITRIEVTQGAQSITDTVGLVAGKPACVRVYLSSGLNGGAGYPPGTGYVGQVTGTLDVQSPVSGATQSLNPLNAGGVVKAPPAVLIDPNKEDEALLFEIPRTFLDEGTIVLTAQAHVVGQASVSAPPTSRSATLLPQRQQDILPVLLYDPVNLNQPPTQATFMATLAQAREKMPVSDQGFVVKTPVAASVPFTADLRELSGWNYLAFCLSTWFFIFPTSDVGGLRTALVANDGRYALNGIGTPRVGLAVPATASRAGLGTTVAHEIGHACGLNHAPCPATGTAGAPADIDPRLPGTIPTAGFDVRAKRVVPTGRGELMSYCGGSTRWPSATYWEYVRTTLPI